MLGLLPLMDPPSLWRGSEELIHILICEMGRSQIQSIYWRIRFSPSIYGGLVPCRTDISGHLLHMMGYLSTDKRDLSTKSLSEQPPQVYPLTQMCLPLNRRPAGWQVPQKFTKRRLPDVLLQSTSIDKQRLGLAKHRQRTVHIHIQKSP